MRIDPETRRRLILPLLAGALGAVYVFGYLPIDRRDRNLDVPLGQSWRQLAATLGQTNALALDFVSLTNQFIEIRSAVDVFDQARKEARGRVELDGALRDQLAQSFLLVEYQYEAGRRMDALVRLAKKENVVLEPAVLGGFPEQSAEMKQPSLLWAELAFLDSLVTTAINAKVTTIHVISAQMPLTHDLLAGSGRSLVELPLQIELTGPIDCVGRFLQTLPLRGDEIKAAGLPEAPTNKPALFIDRLVLRKQTPAKLDEARIALRAVGFVFSK